MPMAQGENRAKTTNTAAMMKIPTPMMGSKAVKRASKDVRIVNATTSTIAMMASKNNVRRRLPIN